MRRVGKVAGLDWTLDSSMGTALVYCRGLKPTRLQMFWPAYQAIVVQIQVQQSAGEPLVCDAGCCLQAMI